MKKTNYILVYLFIIIINCKIASSTFSPSSYYCETFSTENPEECIQYNEFQKGCTVYRVPIGRYVNPISKSIEMSPFNASHDGYMQNCLRYEYNRTTNKVECTQCEIQFAFNAEKNACVRHNIQYCQKGYYDAERGQFLCERCMSFYTTNLESCVYTAFQNYPNCNASMYLYLKPFETEFRCSSCKTGYYYDEEKNSCEENITYMPDCEYFQGSLCRQCKDREKTLVVEKEGDQYGMICADLGRCRLGLKGSPHKCIECYYGEYLDPETNTCLEPDSSLPYCYEYDTTGKCIRCNQTQDGVYLRDDKMGCDRCPLGEVFTYPKTCAEAKSEDSNLNLDDFSDLTVSDTESACIKNECFKHIIEMKKDISSILTEPIVFVDLYNISARLQYHTGCLNIYFSAPVQDAEGELLESRDEAKIGQDVILGQRGHKPPYFVMSYKIGDSMTIYQEKIQCTYTNRGSYTQEWSCVPYDFPSGISSKRECPIVKFPSPGQISNRMNEELTIEIQEDVPMGESIFFKVTHSEEITKSVISLFAISDAPGNVELKIPEDQYSLEKVSGESFYKLTVNYIGIGQYRIASK